MAAAPSSSVDLLELVRKSGLVEKTRLEDWLRGNPELPEQTHLLAAKLVKDGMLTGFHAKHMLTGKYRGFILGQYKVLEQIGAGGMGVIFLAEHVGMKRRVAIKVLPAKKVSDPEALERFYREARVAAALDHPNIVKAYDSAECGSIHFMVMEFIEGESLEQIVQRRGRLPVEEAADYICQAACGLQHAYDRGLIHRDIKPGNLLVEKSGVVKILDMGLARFFQDESNLTVNLGNGAVIGTADYMAPEQAVNSHEVDIRADIYSLGVTFYALLTGEPPFAHEPVAQKLLAHHMRQPMPVQVVRPDIPEGLAAVVARMMAKRPEDRYSMPEKIVEALEPWAGPRLLPASPTMRMASTRRDLPHVVALEPEPRKRRWLWASLAAAAILLASGIGIAMQNRDNRAPAATTTLPTPEQAPVVIQPAPVEPLKPLEPPVGELRQYDTRGEQIERLALAPTNPWFAGGSRQGMVRIWDIDSGKILQEMTGHTGIVWFVAFDPTGEHLVSSGQDGTLRIWNTATGQEVKKINEALKGQTWSAVFSPDGKQIFSGGDDGVGRIWNAETGDLIRTTTQQHSKTINWVAWSPDGALVYSAGWDGALRGWEASTGQQRFVYTEDKKKINLVAVTHDGRHLICSSDNGYTHLLDAFSGARVATFAEKTAGQWAAAFSRDGLRAVTSGSENNFYLWDVGLGTKIHTFTGHTDKIPSCVITPDGRRIITASHDRTLRIWVTPP